MLLWVRDLESCRREERNWFSSLLYSSFFSFILEGKLLFYQNNQQNSQNTKRCVEVIEIMLTVLN